MAGIAENIQVVSNDKSAVFDGELSPTDLTFNLPVSDTSLQELIDSELALRIGSRADSEPEQDAEQEFEPELPVVATTRVQPVQLLLEPDPSERFIQAEKVHTMATLNVFSDTIDLSPSEPTSPLFPRTPVDISPQYENNPFVTPVPVTNLDSDESPVTEDASDLEPIPLFTQTITSDHEQSPLTEANPFLLDNPAVEPLDEDVPEKDSPSIPVEDVLVVVDPPDDPSPVDSPGPLSPQSPGEFIVGEIESDKSPIDVSDPPSVVIEAETEPELETQLNISQEVAEEQLLDFSNDAFTEIRDDSPKSTVCETILNSAKEAVPEFTLTVDSPKPSETDSPKSPESKFELETPEVKPASPVEVETPTDNRQICPSDSDTKASLDSVDCSVVNVNSMREFSVANLPETPAARVTGGDDEWTTVEDAVKEVQSCEALEEFEPQPPDHHAEDIPALHNNVSESISTTTTTKTVKKKKSTEGGDSTTTKTKKTKKTKKSEEKENHISVKSSFSKFDQLQKKTVLHVRSTDASKIQKQLNQEAPEAQGANPTCKACNKTVFAMEQIKAERSVWHKNCFRCKECSKQLTVDIYQSHEGELHCKPHFKELFKPKAVLDNTDEEPLRRRKPEMIIRENQPVELPPDVVRASDKADLGLEELSALNVKSRFQVFEKTTSEGLDVERSPSTVNVKRSPSILSKLAKFQKKGMDVGVTDETLNGVDYEESSSSEDEAQGEDGQVVKSSKLTEKPISFNKMEDVKRSWETSSGSQKTKEELRAEHKKEISQIRSRLFQGKQGKMKEMYEQAVAESEGKVTTKKDPDIVASEKARLLKERFERGEVIHSDSEEDEEKKAKNKDVEDMSVFEAGISKKSRSIFLELDATAAKTQTSPVTPPVHALTPRITERRTSQTEESPDREVYRDPNIVRGEDTAEDETIVKRSQTASRMLSLFRQMEEQKDSVPDGPKPLKCFTPPPDYKEDQSGSGSSEDEEDESDEDEVSDDDGIVRASDKIEDEFLKQAQNAARAKALKEKFEHWEPEKQSVNNAINMLDSEQESIESTKSLRARFESLKAEADQPKEKPRPKVNRFV